MTPDERNARLALYPRGDRVLVMASADRWHDDRQLHRFFPDENDAPAPLGTAGRMTQED